MSLSSHHLVSRPASAVCLPTAAGQSSASLLFPPPQSPVRVSACFTPTNNSPLSPPAATSPGAAASATPRAECVVNHARQVTKGDNSHRGHDLVGGKPSGRAPRSDVNYCVSRIDAALRGVGFFLFAPLRLKQKSDSPIRLAFSCCVRMQISYDVTRTGSAAPIISLPCRRISVLPGLCQKKGRGSAEKARYPDYLTGVCSFFLLSPAHLPSFLLLLTLRSSVHLQVPTGEFGRA